MSLSEPDRLEAAAREERELLLVLARQMPLVLGASVIVAPVCYGVMKLIGEGVDLSLWLTGMFTLLMTRLASLKRFRASPLASPEQIRNWGAVFTIASGTSGCLFGLLGFLATQPSSPLSSIFALMVLVGMAAGSIASLAAAKWAYPAFAIPTMTPIISRHWEMGGPTGYAIAGFGVIFLLVNLGYARIQRRSLIESIRLRFEKEALIGELEDARRRSDAANDSKTRILLSAGHDLRQPLYAITLLIESVERRLPPDALRQAQAMRSCARTIDELLDRMLQIARLDTGKIEAKLEDVPLKGVFERLMIEFSPEAQARESTLACVPSSLIAKADPQLLSGVLRNFLSNALRYGAGGRVLLGARRQGGDIRIEVLDQGPGVAPEHIEAIFEPFYQVGNAERSPENGHGLGLAIAQGMARMMGAQIEARSRPGKGSAFSIAMQAGAAASPAMTPRAALATEALKDAPIILVVEDVAIVRETTCELLTAWGCRPIAAADGAEALEAAARSREPIDCVITDLRLPGDLDGLEIVRQLRAQRPDHLPAIMTTADPASNRGEAEGVTTFIKPIAPSKLREALAAMLGRRRANDPSRSPDAPPERAYRPGSSDRSA